MALDLFWEHAWDASRGVAHMLADVDGRARSGQWPTELASGNFDLLDDQVLMATALLDAFEVTGERRYFDRALELGQIILRRFWDESSGGFFDTAVDAAGRQGALTVMRKAIQDSPTPAGNSVAAALFDRLAVLADRPEFRERAEKTLDLFASRAREYGLYAGTYALALVNHLRAPVEVVVVGSAGHPEREQLLRAAYDARIPGIRVLAFAPEIVRSSQNASPQNAGSPTGTLPRVGTTPSEEAAGSANVVRPESAAGQRSEAATESVVSSANVLTSQLPAGLAATLPNLPLDGRPLALVCSGTSCQPPAASPEELLAALRRCGASPAL